MGRPYSSTDDDEPIGEDILANLDGLTEQLSEDPEASSTAAAVLEEEQERVDSYHTFSGHTQSVFSVAWNPADTFCVASGGQDDSAFLWRTCHPDGGREEELTCLKLEGHTDSVISVSFNHDGTFLATAGMDGKVRIWDMDGALVHTLEGPSDVINWISWHPAGNVVLAGTGDYTSWMWNAQTGQFMQVFTGHGGSVMCGRFTPDGRSAVTAGDELDPSVKVWNPRTAECMTTIRGHGFHEGSINTIDIDGQLIITSSEDCTARVSHLTNGQPTATLREHEKSVESALFKGGVLPLILTSGLDGNAIVWDRTSLTRRQLYTHPAGVACMQDLEDSPMFVTGCMDGRVRIWDTRVNPVVRELRGANDAVQCLALSSNQQMILSGSDDSTVHVYDIRM